MFALWSIEFHRKRLFIELSGIALMVTADIFSIDVDPRLFVGTAEIKFAIIIRQSDFCAIPCCAVITGESLFFPEVAGFDIFPLFIIEFRIGITLFFAMRFGVDGEFPIFDSLSIHFC